MSLRSTVVPPVPMPPKAFEPGLYIRNGVVALVTFMDAGIPGPKRQHQAIYLGGSGMPGPAEVRVGFVASFIELSEWRPFDGSVTLTGEA